MSVALIGVKGLMGSFWVNLDVVNPFAPVVAPNWHVNHRLLVSAPFTGVKEYIWKTHDPHWHVDIACSGSIAIKYKAKQISFHQCMLYNHFRCYFKSISGTIISFFRLFYLFMTWQIKAALITLRIGMTQSRNYVKDPECLILLL